MSNKLKVITTIGISGSGKSTWAEQFKKDSPNTVIVEKDRIRASMGAIVGDDRTRVKESKVIQKRNEMIMEALEKGQNIISSDTNLNPKANHIGNIKSLVFPKYRNQYEFEIKDFTDVPIETCIERCANRAQGREFWERIIKEQSKFLQPVQLYKDINYYNCELPLVVITDLDDTLTFKGERSPYADDCSGDRPNLPVVEIVKMYCDRPDITVICLSGRKESARASTENWLASQGINYDHLYMRAQNDNRRDSIMKREAYETHIKGRYLVHLVIDDRKMVCEMWQEYGLPLLKFGNSNY